MPAPETLWIYLDEPTLHRVERAEHHFFKRLIGAVEAAGWQVALRESTLAEEAAAPERPGYALYHMEAPTHARALTCRRAYIGAFWRIEAQAERWEWPIARAEFRPEEVDARRAENFANYWRKRLYSGVNRGDDGFIFLPLQGRLLEARGFQALGPLEMIDETLARTDLPIRARLHPRESYLPEELDALAEIAAREPRFTLVETPARDLLARCRMVVTQNSSLAFEGFLLHKPAIVFAQIDFHHIARSVPRDGLEAAFSPAPAPEFDRYMLWFLKETALNAGSPAFETQLLLRLRAAGWPI